MDSSQLSIFLTKLASQLVYPLGLVCGLLLMSLVLLVAGRPRSAAAGIVTALTGLWIASLPPVSIWAIGTLERQHPPRPLAATEPADVAILLGGGVENPRSQRIDAELNDGGDRVIHAARLYKAGKVKRILVTGGNVLWVSSDKPEAFHMRAYLMELGVPDNAIEIAGQSRNTAENAREIKALWQAESYGSALLVTSASHMPRALVLFQRAGLPVTSSSTDVRGVQPDTYTLLDALPDAEALARSTRAIKEWLGLLAARSGVYAG